MVGIIMLQTKRKAIAMIELIFAIVIMGIAMLAIPNITAQSAKNAQSVLNQEAVAIATAQMQIILASSWDEQNAQGDESILRTGSHVASNYSGGVNRKFSNTPASITTTKSAIPTNSIDLGDFNGVKTTIETPKATTQDYSDKKLTIKSTVVYASDIVGSYNFNPSQTASGTTDIKRVAVTLTSSENSQENKNITLHAFSCNIGLVNTDSKQLD